MVKNGKADITNISDILFKYGFERVDYVYEPGQYAVRGSILDVYSFSFDQPYRIDFFGDDIESIRSFDIESQLSNDQFEEIFIIPNMMNNEANGISFLEFIDPKTIFGFRDLAWCIERINGIAGETLSDQLLITEEGDLNAGKKIIDPDTFRKKIFEFKRIDYGNKSLSPDAAILRIECSPQPIYHKNFELVIDSFTSFLKEGYTLYILSDSEKPDTTYSKHF